MLIDFRNMPWKSPGPGLRYKSFTMGTQRIRLVEFTEEFVEEDWCTSGHVGYVMEGRLSVDFDGDVVRYSPGDGMFIEERSRHKAKVDKGGKALLILFENAENR